MDLKDIKAIIDLMKKNAISEFELEKQDFKIKLKRGLNGSGTAHNAEEALGIPASAPSTVVSSVPIALSLPTQSSVQEAEIKSPMIGTFYRSPSPESAPYAEIGTEVQPDTVICIIEAMKVMNEIKAEVRGVITQIVAENAKPVEFGQPLFKIKPL